MISENDSSPRRQHDPWNKGRLIGQKRPLKPRDVWTIRVRLQLEGRKRHLALFNLAIDSKLRGCDLVRLQTDDVCVGGCVRDRATVIQKKTGRPVQFEIPEQTRAAVQDWLSSLGARSGRYLFPSRFRERRTSRRDSMLALSMDGWQTLVSRVQPVAPTRCDGQKQLRFTRR